MHSIIISQKRLYPLLYDQNHPSSVSTANSINDEGDIIKVVRLTH